MRPEVGMKMIIGLGHLSYNNDRLRALPLSLLGEEKAPGRTSNSLPLLKGTTRDLERDFSSTHVVRKQGGMAFSGKMVGLDKILGRNS